MTVRMMNKVQGTSAYNALVRDRDTLMCRTHNKEKENTIKIHIKP